MRLSLGSCNSQKKNLKSCTPKTVNLCFQGILKMKSRVEIEETNKERSINYKGGKELRDPFSRSYIPDY